MRALLVIGLVFALIVGGLLTLRSSARTGLPDEEVLRRAQKRADAQREGEGR